ncbi:hypothetical protein N1037_11560 [Phaeobacter sp. G2]|nr:hypothetical protein N1037_11560 [Phaeobacter sp. G2]
MYTHFERDNRTEEEISFARKTILEQAWWRPRVVQNFDMAFRTRLGGRSLEEEITVLKIDEVKEGLRHDPFNFDLMGVIQDWIRLQGQNGSSEMTEAEMSEFRKRIEKDFALRQVIAAPFSEDNWNTLGRFQFDFFQPESLFASDPYYQNAVVYSGLRGRALYGYLGKKAHQLRMLEDVLTQEDHPDILPWKDYARSFDRSGLVNCPFLRAYLLLEQFCAANSGRGYCAEEDLASFAPQLKVAQADQNCDYINGLSPEELAFQPVEVDLSYDPQAHWPAVE